MDDANTLIRVLCHKKDKEASKFLKLNYHLPASSGTCSVPQLWPIIFNNFTLISRFYFVASEFDKCIKESASECYAFWIARGDNFDPFTYEEVNSGYNIFLIDEMVVTNS